MTFQKRIIILYLTEIPSIQNNINKDGIPLLRFSKESIEISWFLLHVVVDVRRIKILY